MYTFAAANAAAAAAAVCVQQEESFFNVFGLWQNCLFIQNKMDCARSYENVRT